MKRQEFIEEQLLRKHIRKAINIVQERRNKSLNEEKQLRKIIRKLIKEAKKLHSAPHDSTGLNVLDRVIGNILSTLEQDYKMLTTDPEQRASFRAHIINAVQNSLAPDRAMDQETESGVQIPDVDDEAMIAEAIKEAAEGPRSVFLGKTQEDDALRLALERPGLKTLAIKRTDPPYDVFVFRKNNQGNWSIEHRIVDKKIADKNASIDRAVQIGRNIKNKWVSIYDDAPEATGPVDRASKKVPRDPSDRRATADRRKYARPKVQSVDDTGAFNVRDFTENKNINEVDIDVGDKTKTRPEEDPAYIPMAPEEVKPEEEFGIEGADISGRNIAYTAYEKVETQILKAYNLLGNAKDRAIFYDYLITNLKLYFDKFEDELRSSIEEPTTPDYEREKQTQFEPGEV